jgi:tetratricopeptide (TPR) repeat protein
MNRLRALLSRHTALAVFAAALVSMPAHADEAADVNALLQAKRFDTALAKASSYLEKNPRDPQMRFLQGVSLSSMGRQSEAISVFTALTTDFPDLAEPYNNLAVLHAAAREYDSARVALEKAIRADPDYVTAYENLGDLYLQLANQAYGKVVQLAPDNANARMRQSLLGKVNAQAAEKTPPVADQKTTMSAAAPEKEAVLAVIKAWAQAWSARDVSAYLNYYAPEFRTPQQAPRLAWEAKRRALIEGRAKIEVAVESPQVSLRDHLATVKYRQKYVSGRYSSRERKTLVLRKYDDGWKIIEERSGR